MVENKKALPKQGVRLKSYAGFLNLPYSEPFTIHADSWNSTNPEDLRTAVNLMRHLHEWFVDPDLTDREDVINAIDDLGVVLGRIKKRIDNVQA